MNKMHAFPSDIRVIIRINEELRDLRLPENHPAAIRYPNSYTEYPYPYNLQGLSEYRNMFTNAYFKADEDDKYKSKDADKTRRNLELEIDASRKEGWLTPLGAKEFLSKLKLKLDSNDKVLDLRQYDDYLMYVIAYGQNEREIAKDSEDRKGAKFYMMDDVIDIKKQSQKVKIELLVFSYITKIANDRYELLLLKSMMELGNHYLTSKTQDLVSELLVTAKTSPSVIYELIKNESDLKCNKFLQLGLILGYIKKTAFDFHYKDASYKKAEILVLMKTMLAKPEGIAVFEGWIAKFKEKYKD